MFNIGTNGLTQRKTSLACISPHLKRTDVLIEGEKVEIHAASKGHKARGLVEESKVGVRGQGQLLHRGQGREVAEALEARGGQGREPDLVEDAEVGQGPASRVAISNAVKVEGKPERQIMNPQFNYCLFVCL